VLAVAHDLDGGAAGVGGLGVLALAELHAGQPNERLGSFLVALGAGG
jgi:hypothetical protein